MTKTYFKKRRDRCSKISKRIVYEETQKRKRPKKCWGRNVIEIMCDIEIYVIVGCK